MNTSKKFSSAIFPAFGDKNPLEFDPLTLGCEFKHTQIDFSEEHISAPEIFTHAIDCMTKLC